MAENAHVIVNAANGQLNHGAGVAGALNTASGGQLQIYSNQYIARLGRELRDGETCTTPGGGALRCRNVVHAVGPRASPTLTDARASQLISDAITRSLREAELVNAASIAIPALSCGIFGIRRELSAGAILNAILNYAYPVNARILSDMRIVIIDQATYDSFAQVMTEYWRRRDRDRPPKIIGMCKQLVCTLYSLAVLHTV